MNCKDGSCHSLRKPKCRQARRAVFVSVVHYGVLVVVLAFLVAVVFMAAPKLHFSLASSEAWDYIVAVLLVEAILEQGTAAKLDADIEKSHRVLP